jgi:branched-chain amino acid transport system substrate-binding protein
MWRILIRTAVGLDIVAGLALAFSGAAAAQTPLKIGLVQPMTGAFNPIGKAAVNGARLYIQEHGDTVAGRKVVLIVKDDASAPDQAKRLAQELIVNDRSRSSARASRRLRWRSRRSPPKPRSRPW